MLTLFVVHIVLVFIVNQVGNHVNYTYIIALPCSSFQASVKLCDFSLSIDHRKCTFVNHHHYSRQAYCCINFTGCMISCVVLNYDVNFYLLNAFSNGIFYNLLGLVFQDVSLISADQT